MNKNNAVFWLTMIVLMSSPKAFDAFADIVYIYGAIIGTVALVVALVWGLYKLGDLVDWVLDTIADACMFVVRYCFERVKPIVYWLSWCF